MERRWNQRTWEEREINLIPETVGVNQLLDRLGRVLYVGCAKDLRSRLLKHLREGDVQGVERFRYAEHRSVEEAQEAEEELIEELG